MEILIDEETERETHKKFEKEFRLSMESRERLKKKSNSNSQLDKEERDMDGFKEKIPEEDEVDEETGREATITPFPTRNRLCSIYSSRKIEDKKFNLSFCLPRVELPSLGLFHPEEMEVGRVYRSKEDK